MKIYLDLLILLNFTIDFLLLLTVSFTLKRKTNLLRIFLAALIGEISLLYLFVPMNEIILFIFKIFISLIMVIVAFKYENFKYTFNNCLYLFMTSFILGGFLFYLKNEFNNNYYIFLLLISPLILIVYLKTQKKLENNYQFYFQTKIVFKNNKEIILSSFLDTGNKLVDPITNKGIILVEKDILDGLVRIRSPIYVPYNSLNHHSLLKCIAPKYIIINNHKFTNFLIGISEDKFKMDGIKCILNYKVMEGLNV